MCKSFKNSSLFKGGVIKPFSEFSKILLFKGGGFINPGVFISRPSVPLRKHFPKASSTCEALSTLNVDPFIMKRGIQKSKFADLILDDYQILLFITF